MKQRQGYMTVEAAVLLPTASILLLLLVYLCSYLYQGCFLVQASYTAAFRGSRYPQRGEAYVQEQLNELLEGEVLAFGQEERRVKVSNFTVQVHLQRKSPLLSEEGKLRELSADWKLPVRNPVAYIRGISGLKEISDAK